MKEVVAADRLPAIAPLLLERLREAIAPTGTRGVLEPAIPVGAIEEIPLTRAKNTQQILYISAIALKLAKTWKQPAMELAEAIAARCTESQAGVSFSIRAVSPGWIHLQLSDRALANWLQSLSEFSAARNRVCSTNPVSPLQAPENPDKLFPVQYAHARCCSLLRLAHREGVVSLSVPKCESEPPVWEAIAPHPIPWLNETSLQLAHPAERHLISELVSATDALWHAHLPAAPPKDWFKIAADLSQTFESFYSACRIWGEVKRENPSLALARLGLILATQSVLGWILQNLFGVCAPLEL